MRRAPAICPVVLSGRFVRLEPICLNNVDALVAAATENRSSYAFTRVPENHAEMTAYIAAALAQQRRGRALAFAVHSNGRIVGSTRFLNLMYWDPTAPWSRTARIKDQRPPDAAHIGYTWLAASAQRTGLNTECKFLMLTHAFQTWGVQRVTIKTDVLNMASRRAIESLGARFEGLRRAEYLRADGSVRDSAYYSILHTEWPQIRLRLLTRLRTTADLAGTIPEPPPRGSAFPTSCDAFVGGSPGGQS